MPDPDSNAPLPQNDVPQRLPANRNAGRRTKVVVLGGGFGGLAFAQALDTRNIELTLVDRRNHHLFQPLLYQVATAGLSAPDIAQPIRSILSGKENTTVVMDTVKSIDVEQRTVHLEEDAPLQYDYLVVALGARSTYFGNDHWADFAPGLKSLNDALRVRNVILNALERAEITEDPTERAKLLTIVFVGAGPTGVELAGATSELARSVLKKDFNFIAQERVRVVLIDRNERVLKGFDTKSSARAQKQLERLGVELKLGSSVEDIRQDEIILTDEVIHSGCIIWTAGVEVAPVVRTLPCAQDRAGRLKVQPDCSLPDYPEVFALGDLLHLTDAKGQIVPGVAQGAIQTGKYVADIIEGEVQANHVPGQGERKPFAYFDKGNMATVGRSKAVAEIGTLRLGGFIAWFLWLSVHLLFLVGFRNRLSVLTNWVFQYVTFHNGARVIWGRGKEDREQPAQEKAGAPAAGTPA
ncbi:MAG: NAD(P)/FAD-dependent oxidoreductase [Opitutales bacterium]